MTAARRAGPPPPASAAPNPLPPPDAAAALHLVRENLRLLAGLAARYEAGRLDPAAGPLAPPAGTPGERVFRGPGEVYRVRLTPKGEAAVAAAQREAQQDGGR